MRRLPVLLLALLVFAVPAFAASSMSVPSKLSSVLPKVRSRSGVAVRLPSRVPVDAGTPRVYGAIEQVSKGRYHLSLGYGRGCHESTACFLAAFFGRRDAGLTLKRNVSLARGITGRFRGISCGASCSPAEVQWKQGGVAYAIQFKGSKSRLIALANSAIRGGAR